MASVKPISTIKTALPSFDILFYLAAVVAVVAVVVVVVVIVVVEYIIILIIIMVVLIDFAELQLCQTVHLESLHFFKPLIFPRKVITQQIEPFVVGSLSYGQQGRICFLSSKIQLPEG